MINTSVHNEMESMKNKGLISVIIPVYNVELYLRKCIASVQQNTYPYLEIICINDGSTDLCGCILDEMAAQDSRIRVIHQANQGVAAARNAGLENASGEFIAFIDSDDFIHPRYFETLLNCLTETNADMAVCGCRKYTENENVDVEAYLHIKYRKIDDQEFFKHYYTRHMIWARLYRKTHLRNIRFTADVRMADDTLFNLRTTASIESPVVYETDAMLYYYLQRSSSIVHTGKAERMIDTGNWYFKHREMVMREYDGAWNWMLLVHVIKATLSYRHTVRYIHRDDESVRHADRILRMSYQDLLKTKKYAVKDSVVLWIMIRSSRLYRLFRIIQDPTMLDWEKAEKTR